MQDTKTEITKPRDGGFEWPKPQELKSFAIKAVVLYALLLLVSRLLPHAPAIFAAVVWAALSTVSALWLAYHATVRKAQRQLMLKQGGKLSELNGGRVITLLIAFVFSAAFAASLVADISKWGVAEWVVAVLGAPLYVGVATCLNHLLKAELEAPFQASKTALASCIVTAVLMSIVYLVILHFQTPQVFNSVEEAFLAAGNPFENSPVALLAELGKVFALVDGLTAYALSGAAQASHFVWLVWRFVLCVMTFFGLSNLVGCCSLRWGELRKAFLTLDALKEPGEHAPVVRRFVAVAVVLPLCLVVLFFGVNTKAQEVASSDGYTAAEQFVRERIGVVACVIDGKNYNWQLLEEYRQKMQDRSWALSEGAQAVLVPLINKSFDARVANVDKYLDWYYSLLADYERLGNLVVGKVESYVTEEYAKRIEEGIDDSELAAELEKYTAQAEELEKEYGEQISEFELHGVPDWLIIERTKKDASYLTAPIEPTSKFLSWQTRMSGSAVAGIGAGFIVKQLVKRAAKGKFFSGIVSRVTSFVAGRGVGSAVGGAAGSLVGPGGTVAGVAAGTVAQIGIDYGLLKLDELQNREKYKDELVGQIEAERQAALAAVQGTG